MAEKIISMLYFFDTSSYNLEKLSFLIEREPNNAKLYAERAKLYYKQNDFGLAMKDCQQAIVFDPTNQEFKKLWNNIILKSISYYSNMQTYKMQISNLIQ